MAKQSSGPTAANFYRWCDQNGIQYATKDRPAVSPESLVKLHAWLKNRKLTAGERKLLEIIDPPSPVPLAVAAVPTDDPEQQVTLENVVKRFGLNNLQKDRLRHKLTAWRGPANSTEWTEVQDRKPRQPRYIYRLGSIQYLIDAVKSAE